MPYRRMLCVFGDLLDFAQLASGLRSSRNIYLGRVCVDLFLFCWMYVRRLLSSSVVRLVRNASFFRAPRVLRLGSMLFRGIFPHAFLLLLLLWRILSRVFCQAQVPHVYIPTIQHYLRCQALLGMYMWAMCMCFPLFLGVLWVVLRLGIFCYNSGILMSNGAFVAKHSLCVLAHCFIRFFGRCALSCVGFSCVAMFFLCSILRIPLVPILCVACFLCSCFGLSCRVLCLLVRQALWCLALVVVFVRGEVFLFVITVSKLRYLFVHDLLFLLLVYFPRHSMYRIRFWMSRGCFSRPHILHVECFLSYCMSDFLGDISRFPRVLLYVSVSPCYDLHLMSGYWIRALYFTRDVGRIGAPVFVLVSSLVDAVLFRACIFWLSFICSSLFPLRF